MNDDDDECFVISDSVDSPQYCVIAAAATPRSDSEQKWLKLDRISVSVEQETLAGGGQGC